MEAFLLLRKTEQWQIAVLREFLGYDKEALICDKKENKP